MREQGSATIVWLNIALPLLVNLVAALVFHVLAHRLRELNKIMGSALIGLYAMTVITVAWLGGSLSVPLWVVVASISALPSLLVIAWRGRSYAIVRGGMNGFFREAIGLERRTLRRRYMISRHVPSFVRSSDLSRRLGHLDKRDWRDQGKDRYIDLVNERRHIVDRLLDKKDIMVKEIYEKRTLENYAKTGSMFSSHSRATADEVRHRLSALISRLESFTEDQYSLRICTDAVYVSFLVCDDGLLLDVGRQVGKSFDGRMAGIRSRNKRIVAEYVSYFEDLWANISHPDLKDRAKIIAWLRRLLDEAEMLDTLDPGRPGLDGIVPDRSANPQPIVVALTGAKLSSVKTSVDFAIITALEEERDAVLSKLPGHRKLDKTSNDVRTYYEAEISTRRGDSVSYRVVVTCLCDTGPQLATAAASAVVARWRPTQVLLVGIACGIPGETEHGDVLVPKQVADYSVGKLLPDGSREIRWEPHRASANLLDSAAHLAPAEWADLIHIPRPGAGTVVRRAGVVASGGDVISNDEIIATYRSDWPKLIGIEMEAGGIATGLHQTSDRPEFLMIKAVSDHGKDKKDPAVLPWRAYACDVAAAFAVGLIRTGSAKRETEER
jgi:nucleoside phosphorylase